MIGLNLSHLFDSHIPCRQETLASRKSLQRILLTLRSVERRYQLTMPFRKPRINCTVGWRNYSTQNYENQ